MTAVLAILKTLALDFLSSKKAMSTAAALIVAAAARYGFHVDGTDIVAFLSTVSLYVVGQGIADNGKEAGVANRDAALITAASIQASGVVGGQTLAAYDKARLAFLSSKLPAVPKSITPEVSP